MRLPFSVKLMFGMDAAVYSRRKNIPLAELYIGSSWEQIEKKPPHSGAPLPPTSTNSGHPAVLKVLDRRPIDPNTRYCDYDTRR